MFLQRKINKLKQKNAILLFNAGIDSSLAWSALDKIDSCFLMFNHKATGHHIDLLRKIKNEHEIDNIHISSHIFCYIPQSETLYYIYLIYHALILFPTKYIIFPKTFSSTFNVKLFVYLLKAIDKDKRVLCPFLNTTREELYNISKINGQDVNYLFQNTYSCIMEKDEHCGFCINCIERLIFFRTNGLDLTYNDTAIAYSNWSNYVKFSNIQISLKSYYRAIIQLSNNIEIFN